MLGQNSDAGIYKNVKVMARDFPEFQFAANQIAPSQRWIRAQTFCICNSFSDIFNLVLYTIAAAYADRSCRFCYAEARF